MAKVATKKRPRTPGEVGKKWSELLRLLPGYDPFRDAGECWFDAATAQRAIEFIEECTCHIEGDLADQPFLLGDWQKSYVANLFGWLKIDGKGRTVRRFRQSLLYVPRKNGKALDVDTPIPTPDGWKAMGDLVAGDEVFDERGEVCRVLEAHPVMTGHPCYRVGFSDGTAIRADAAHLWTVRDRYLLRDVTLTTEQMAGTHLIGSRPTHRERRYTLPPAEALRLPERDLPIEPYTLGVWLGDGDSDCARITNSCDDGELLDHLRAAGTTAAVRRLDPRSKARRVLLGSNGRGQPGSLQSKLRAAGLLHNKHVPPAYLRASEAQRLALLQGLMDTDGSASKAGQCEFVTTSAALFGGCLELLRTLGFKPTVKVDRARLRGVDCGPRYRIQFWAFADRPVFRLSRKAARLKAVPAGAMRSATRQVVSVEPIESCPVRCIRVDSPSSLFRAGPGMVPTHNTPLVAAISLYVFFCDNEAGQQNYVAASCNEQAALLFRQADGMVEREPELRSRCKTYSKAAGGALVRDDNSFMKVISGEAKGKHGGNPHLLIVDELHEQPNRDLIDTLTTSMASLNRKQSLMIYLTTADFERPSIANEKHRYACDVRDGLRPDPKFLPAIWEAKNEEDWTDPKVWARANPNLEVSVSEDFLTTECEKAKANPSLENTFKRLHLNMKTATDVKWIDAQLWAKGGEPFDEETLLGRECFAGLDFGWRDDYAALVLVFKVGEEFYCLPWFWLPRDGRRDRRVMPTCDFVSQGLVTLTPGNATDCDAIYDVLRECRDKYALNVIVLDPNNARKQTQDFQNEGYEVEDFFQSKRNYNEPCRLLEVLLKEGKLRHNGNPVLAWMAGNVTAELDGLGQIMPKKMKSAEKIDGICALLMALSKAMVAEEVSGEITWL